MRYLILSILFLTSFAISAQEYKDEISVVQFSAGFVKDSEINLKSFRECHVYTFYIEKNKNYFDAESIKYLPTILLFQNGKEVMRVETGISMKFPENTNKQIRKKIEELIGNKF